MLNKIIYTILGFGLAFIFLPHNVNDTSKHSVISGVTTQNVEAKKISAPELASSRTAPVLTAKSALAYDFESGTVLYSKNLDEKLPIASLTKLMTALVAMDNAKTEEVVEVRKEDQTPIGSVLGLVEGEKIRLGDLMQGMLIPSANDAALTVAGYVGGGVENFVEKMNAKAAQMGLLSTQFSNPVGWDSDDNYSTALDLKKIVEEFEKHPDLVKIVATKEAEIYSVDKKYSHKLATTNKLLLDNPEVVGIKTGFTSKALGNLIIMTNHNDRKIVTIVLGSENREDDAQKLTEWIFLAYRW